MPRWPLVLVLLASAAPVLAADPTLPPTRTRALERWLDAGGWRATYTAEPAVHPSNSAHGRSVRTWYSPSLVEDLAAGRTSFRKGAAMVKELFDPSGSELRGFAVMRKVRARSRGGGGWFFWETAGRTPLRGRGLGICTGCHAQGLDFLLSEFRP